GDGRPIRDAGRLFSRLMRQSDLACQDDDGSILVVFTDTDLRSGHVIARRLAAALRSTMLLPQGEHRPVSPTVTVATLRPTDTLGTLMGRIAAQAAIAAE